MAHRDERMRFSSDSGAGEPLEGAAGPRRVPHSRTTDRPVESKRRPQRVVYYYEDGVEEHVLGSDDSMPPERDDSMGALQEKARPVSPANPRIGSTGPLGLLAFGMTTLLYNVHNAQICPLNMATMGLVVMYGGLTQFVCGFLELINMNTFMCTISTTYGSFWMATAVLFLVPTNSNVIMGDHLFSGGFFLLWFFVSGGLLLCTLRQPLLSILLFAMVPLNFFMQCIGFFSQVRVITRIAGFEGILVGILAIYLAIALSLRDVYGKTVFPLLFHEKFRIVEL